ncbi:unnamed protein product [Amoebophrya sp. A25]|nr:unnamed protein product [Amoebophrya sp. A25]|eukprot:GSA25T00005952001.1
MGSEEEKLSKKKKVNLSNGKTNVSNKKKKKVGAFILQASLKNMRYYQYLERQTEYSSGCPSVEVLRQRLRSLLNKVAFPLPCALFKKIVEVLYYATSTSGSDTSSAITSSRHDDSAVVGYSCMESTFRSVGVARLILHQALEDPGGRFVDAQADLLCHLDEYNRCHLDEHRKSLSVSKIETAEDKGGKASTVMELITPIVVDCIHGLLSTLRGTSAPSGIELDGRRDHLERVVMPPNWMEEHWDPAQDAQSKPRAFRQLKRITQLVARLVARVRISAETFHKDFAAVFVKEILPHEEGNDAGNPTAALPSALAVDVLIEFFSKLCLASGQMLKDDAAHALQEENRIKLLAKERELEDESKYDMIER